MFRPSYLTLSLSLVAVSGCDHHYGPSRQNIEEMPRPFMLFMEFPMTYHGTPFNHMSKTVAARGTRLISSKDHHLESKDTQYVDRGMRVVEFVNV